MFKTTVAAISSAFVLMGCIFVGVSSNDTERSGTYTLTAYHANGQKRLEERVVDGKLIYRAIWAEDGSLLSEDHRPAKR